MTEPPPAPAPPEVPESTIEPRRHFLPQLIWAIPILAALIGISMAAHAITQRGPTITITFRTAEGLDAGKTKIKFKNVDIGEVRSIALSPDRRNVVVTAEMSKQVEGWLTDDTRFWVVRARLAAGQVLALGTLLTGSYIGADLGTSDRPGRAFVGRETPIAVPGDEPGRSFTLVASQAVEAGSPIYYRHFSAGLVTATQLDRVGDRSNVTIFVRQPYDRLVTPSTRFWNAGGVDVTVGETGVNVKTESLTSLLLGGIAFETPPHGSTAAPAEADQRFELYPDRDSAMKRTETEVQRYRLVFHESVRGLSLGSPVDIRGLVVGEVSVVGIEYDEPSRQFAMLVDIDVYPERVRERLLAPPKFPGRPTQDLVRDLVEHGLRAQLRGQNLLTRQQYVALDFFPYAPRKKFDPSQRPPEIPTVPGGADQLQRSLTSVARKLDRVPIEQIGGEAHQFLAGLRSTLAQTDTFVRQLNETTPRPGELRETMRELGRAARALRTLAETLERDPESLLRGRRKTGP